MIPSRFDKMTPFERWLADVHTGLDDEPIAARLKEILPCARRVAPGRAFAISGPYAANIDGQIVDYTLTAYYCFERDSDGAWLRRIEDVWLDDASIFDVLTAGELAALLEFLLPQLN